MRGHEGTKHLAKVKAGFLEQLDLAGTLLQLLPPTTGGPHLVTAGDGVTATELFEQGSVLPTNFQGREK